MINGVAGDQSSERSTMTNGTALGQETCSQPIISVPEDCSVLLSEMPQGGIRSGAQSARYGLKGVTMTHAGEMYPYVALDLIQACRVEPDEYLVHGGPPIRQQKCQR